MSEGNGIPSKAAIDLAVHEIVSRDGFIVDDKFDLPILRNRMFDAIRTAKVLAKKERAEKAVRRPQLLATLFPSLPTPELFDHQADPPLAEKVYTWLSAKAWGETKPGADSPLQRLVGVNMGNGYVMCRTKIGELDAVYITDDIDCVRVDFTRPENDVIERRLAMATRNREMLVLRQPDNAAKYANEYSRTLRGALAAAATQIQLAVDAATGNHAEPEVDENEGEAAAMFEPHPLAKVLPAMSGEDYARLRDDIAENGLLDPITLYEGKVLDGIHRQKVCAETKIEPHYEPFTGDDPIRFVFSKNIARRHLTTGQRAMLGAEIRSHGHGGDRKGGKDQVRNSALDLTRDEVAAIVGVDRSTVTAAARVKKERPDLARKVKAGKTSLNAAYEETVGRHTGGNGPRRTKAWNGKTNPTRQREIRTERRNGAHKDNYNELLRLSLDMNRACSIIESYLPLLDDFSIDQTSLDLIDTFHDDLITLAEWVDKGLMRTVTWLGDVKVRRKIAALRDTKGRGPEESATALALADKLERKLAALLPVGV